MTNSRAIEASLLAAWRTNNRVTLALVESLSDTLLDARVPEIPRRTVRMIAAHLHNARCRWIRTLGREHGVATPERVDQRRVTRRQLLTALKRSATAMEKLLQLGFRNGGQLPPSKGYVWRNLSLDVGHFVTYFVAHEAHHRGQIVMIARQLGTRLPESVTGRLWWWRTPAQAKRRQRAR